MKKHEGRLSFARTIAAIGGSIGLLAAGALGIQAHSGPSLKAPLTTGPFPVIDGTIESAWGPERTGAPALCTSMNLYAVRSATTLYLAVDVPELTADPDDTLLVYFDINHNGGGGPDGPDRALRVAGFPAGTGQTPATSEIYSGNGLNWGSVESFTTVMSSRTGSGNAARLAIELTLPVTSAPVGFALVYASKDLQDCNGDADFGESAIKWPPALPTPGGDALAGVRVPNQWGDLGVVEKGTFTVTNLPIANFPGWTATANATPLAGDFDGDGKTDLAVTGPADWSSLPTAFSKGNGTFGVTNFSIVNFATWAATANVDKVAGDFNGDGRTDIGLTGAAGWTSLPVAFSNGDGRYIVTNYPLADFPGMAAATGARPLAGDFNGDGRTDIALTGASGWTTLPVAFSNGDGTFTATPPPIQTLTLNTFAINRVAIAAAANPSIMTAVLNPAIGTVLTIQPTIAEFAGWAATANARSLVGDFNGDGKSDIALTGVAGWTTLPIAFSHGNGTFTVTNLAVGDFAGLAATPPQPLSDDGPMLTAGGTRTPPIIVRPFRFATVKILTGDFNGDGKTDIALTGARDWTTLPVAFSNGNGTFNVTKQPIVDFSAFAASFNAKALTGDFNNDGKTDVALTGTSGWTTLPVAFSNGNGTFIVTNQPVADFAGLSALSGARPVVGDFNGDGKADIALTGRAGWTTLPVAFSQSQ